MPDRRNDYSARTVPCDTPLFAPRRTCPRGMPHHYGAARDADGGIDAPRSRTMLRCV
ncbi:hypothetical protein BSLA_02f2527 [Burkholderia stabilis]|nr:hypothetical protein BSLA_02f2527 [Burkholderia stabilis]